ncbi:MAG: hypothetical protein V2I43_18195, partial [Parvularcula sp.]|nr:hypothetical protein [Parvularcula sp.]
QLGRARLDDLPSTRAAPTRQGLGSRLIHEFLPTGRRAQVDFDAGGLVWTGRIPIDGHSTT